jgi:hypothetical protein
MSTEMQRMWNMKCFVIAVITGAAGVISKSLKNVETVPGQHSVQKLPY